MVAGDNSLAVRWEDVEMKTTQWKEAEGMVADSSKNAKKKPVELSGRDLHQSHFERTRSNLVSCLQTVQCAPGSQLF